MRKLRLAYRLWLVEDDGLKMTFSDKRNLTSIRIFTFSIFLLCSGLIFYMISSGKDAPLPIIIFLGAMAFIFLLVFILKSGSHVEAELNKGSREIIVWKKRFSSNLSEQKLKFDQIRNIRLVKVYRRDDRGSRPDITQGYFEILLSFTGGENMVFSAINAPDAARSLGNKIAAFLGKTLE